MIYEMGQIEDGHIEGALIEDRHPLCQGVVKGQVSTVDRVLRTGIHCRQGVVMDRCPL